MLRRVQALDREENPDPRPARNRPMSRRFVAGSKKGLDRDVAIREPHQSFGHGKAGDSALHRQTAAGSWYP